MNRVRRKYLVRLGIGFDQFVNTICGGDPDETISARAWRQRDKKKVWMFMQLFIDHLFFLQKDHCYHAYLEEKNRSQLTDHYLK